MTDFVDTQNTETKCLTLLSDGRVLAAWKVETHWNGEVYFSEDGTALLQDTVYSWGEYFNENVLMGNTGLTHANDIFLVNLRLERAKTFAALQNGSKVAANTQSGHVVVSNPVFKLPFEVDRYFYDFAGNVKTQLHLDSLPTGEWIIVVLKRKDIQLRPSRPTIRRRGPRTNGRAGTVRPRDDAAQETRNSVNDILRRARARLGHDFQDDQNMPSADTVPAAEI